MNQVYQYASLNMGWCVNCHVNGYDPAEGDRAAGYTRAADGTYQLTKTADAGAVAGGVSLVAAANAQTTQPAQPAASVPNLPGGTSLAGPRKRARYDCAICHY